LVVNLHGLNSNAAQQQSYSQFDLVADSKKYIVVYPNAVGGSWVINGSSDVDFISHLIDTIRNNFSCNNCLFVTGMSQGGFLTYKLACALPQVIKAIGVVSGNMSQSLQNSCNVAAGLPVLHFHGNADQLVNYNGTTGIPPVLTTINWWVTKNACNTNVLFNALPDINVSDNCTVEKYYYGSGTAGSNVTFYKILNGGHTWPGASPIPAFGPTNLDINASQIIGDFFNQFCSTTTGIVETKPEQLSLYPNPFTSNISIDNTNGSEIFNLSTIAGQTIWTGENINDQNFSGLPSGVYFLDVKNKNGQKTFKLLKQ
jgi:polyhydroxybutyrate depolymerase